MCGDPSEGVAHRTDNITITGRPVDSASSWSRVIVDSARDLLPYNTPPELQLFETILKQR